ncbi:SAM-dependent methyltransferase [Acuticoccus mangrovi]|uniref:SAM-dependent methyltransferase n=1 Tax=Acuticoccus mangrovi TaxID=2796142 RepID=A0A934IME9_9HYPH|nr:SAM-dependent methyltransferase [Acuticoccus mangrovi]MBJ3774084.1 SAM-dependent methyltransferase [Acuticoccus mangrovi]
MMFDRTRLASRPRLAEADFLHTFAAREIVERLALVNRRFATGLVTGPLTPAIREVWAEAAVDFTYAGPALADAPDVVADVRLPFRRAFALAISINEIHVADDPVTMLGELRGTLAADGLFLGAVPSAGTLDELADALLVAEAELSDGAAMRVAPFADVRRWGNGLSRAGFALPVADEMRLTVRYDNLAHLLRDIGAMGLKGILAARRPAPRRLFERAEAVYRARYGDPDGRLRATFAFAFLSGWAPDPSQQKPAKRGSATHSLEAALKKLERG